MIKRIPYSNNLINIGNACHTAGNPVWSDGRVAYGWNYVPEAKRRVPVNYGGLWVGQEVNNTYRLAHGLVLGNQIVGRFPANVDRGYCYPWIAYGDGLSDVTAGYDGGTMTNGTISYNFEGSVVAMDAQGGLLTYKNFELIAYSLDNQGNVTVTRTDLSVLSQTTAIYIPYEDLFGNYVDSLPQNMRSSNARRVFQLATTSGAWIKVRGIVYYCASGNVVAQAMPSIWRIGAGTSNNYDYTVDLRLADMALVINYIGTQQTQEIIQNDPLGLLSVTGLTYAPACQHAYINNIRDNNGIVCDKYIIGQIRGFLWYNAQQTSNRQWDLIECFSAAWLNRRWIV